MKKIQGFTLTEVMVVIAILGILAAFAIPSYAKHLKTNRLREAQAKMVENASFLEREYARNSKFDASVSLPNKGTGFFDIKLSTTDACTERASGKSKSDSFCMIASPVASYKAKDSRVLVLTETGELVLCSGNVSTSTCESF